MGKTSNKAKQDWNASHYKQVKVSVKPETAGAFKAACVKRGVSMAGELQRYMQRYAGFAAGYAAPDSAVTGASVPDSSGSAAGASAPGFTGAGSVLSAPGFSGDVNMPACGRGGNSCKDCPNAVGSAPSRRLEVNAEAIADLCKTKTLRDRRKVVTLIKTLIERLIESETEYMDNMPANLQQGERYELACERAERLADALEEVESVCAL